MPIGEPIVIGNHVSEKWAEFFQYLIEMDQDILRQVNVPELEKTFTLVGNPGSKKSK